MALQAPLLILFRHLGPHIGLGFPGFLGGQLLATGCRDKTVWLHRNHFLTLKDPLFFVKRREEIGGDIG